MYYSGYDLIKAFNEGSNQAFSILYKELHASLYYFTKSFVEDDQAAEDIVLETFMKLWNHRGEFENDKKLKGFLWVTARNASLTHIKRAKKQSDREKDFQYLFSGEYTELFSTEEIRAQVISTLYEEIENLPNKCRDIAKMVFFEHLPINEIAWRLGIAEKTVRAQKDRARQLLKSAIYKKGIFIVLPALFILYKD